MATPEAQLQLEFAQHQQHLLNVQAQQAAEEQAAAAAALHATPNPVKAQANLELQRQLLQQKLAETSVLSSLDPNNLTSGLEYRSIAGMASPTDSIMSPCSKMLQKQKNKQYGKAKPRLLNKAFAQSAAAQVDKDKENQKATSTGGGLFGSAKAPIPKDEPIF